MMANLYNILSDLLKQDERFLSSDGELLKNVVYEAAYKNDVQLIKSLQKNETLRSEFFTIIDNNLEVFNTVKFGWVVSNRKFLPDSYTRFANKIGLIETDGEFISKKDDVVLAFPHKDCILEGGQTKEDQKKDEIFYNETLVPDEVNTLLSPKVLINATKYIKNNQERVTKIEKSDNLLIKGNNLICLSSILKRYENKIKCIYIDPPYNTDNDGFNYNDKFNHSSWLVFIKNRLEIAKKLLQTDGVIFVSLDDKEAHYCKVLMDEIFGRENFIADICHKSRASISNDKIISPNHNHILFYAKNERVVFSKKEEYGIKKDTSTFTEKDENGEYYRLVPVDGPGGAAKGNPYYEFLGITNYWRFSKTTMQTMYNNGMIVKRGNSLYQKYMRSKADGSRQTITTWWDEGLLTSTATSSLNQILDDKFSNPKNESLIELILEFSTKPDDFVLDFFAGSGTTAAVAHKLNRHYIIIEQMDYIEHITLERMKKVMSGEQTGISKSVNWNGGGSFIYCELMKLNHKYIDMITSTNDDYILNNIYAEICQSEYISTKINPKEIQEFTNNFSELSIDNKKSIMLKLLDLNMLYVNESDIDDKTYNISEEDKLFNRSFYGDN